VSRDVSSSRNFVAANALRLAKEKVEERLRPDAKPGYDMLQAFINDGMTYDELIQHMFVQM